MSAMPSIAAESVRRNEANTGLMRRSKHTQHAQLLGGLGPGSPPVSSRLRERSACEGVRGPVRRRETGLAACLTMLLGANCAFAETKLERALRRLDLHTAPSKHPATLSTPSMLPWAASIANVLFFKQAQGCDSSIRRGFAPGAGPMSAFDHANALNGAGAGPGVAVARNGDAAAAGGRPGLAIDRGNALGAGFGFQCFAARRRKI
jgi:hypothetical protein